MAINSMQEAFSLSDQEIEQFLKEYWENEEFEFSGEYDGEKFTGIKSGNKLIKYPVNKNKPFIKIRTYRCESGKRYFFHCELAPRTFRESINNAFIINVIPSTIRPDISREIDSVKYRLRLEDDYFIGQFIPEGRGGNWIITDIRNTDFTKVEDKERGVKDISIRFNARGLQPLNKFAYYRFSWTLISSNPLQFGIDLTKELKPMYPKDIVRCLYSGIIGYPASASKKITRSLDTLRNQLTQSGKEVFIYELLQNANDYPKKTREKEIIPVDVEFHLTDQYLIFQHTGEYFNPKNIAAICDINDEEKTANIEAIGYKGIGFKTVFLDNDYVYLHTGNYSFRFDKDATDRINTPWQILPVWTEPRNIYPVVQTIFERTQDDDFRVKFALKPRDSKILTDQTKKDNYVALFTRVFETERVILFIPNIHKVSIYFGNKPTPDIVRSADSSAWCVSKSYSDDVPDFVKERIDKALADSEGDRADGYEKIPEKYLHFNKTAIKFACKRDGRKLLPVEKANLYCYLPAKRANWGFNFLMNTDMLPNGARDDIEDIELNHEIAKIAGRQFFYWIKDLISSGDYEFESIFSLIPDFDECKKNHSDYETFIDDFQNEFESLIKEMPFIPVIDVDGKETDACITTVIDDLTGITEKGVMSDSDFISLMDRIDYYLPIQELRESDSFMEFLWKYCPKEMDVDFSYVKNKCSEDDFQRWLKNSENNTKFLNHLLEESKLDEFKTESIFIEFEGDLYKAQDLYYNFDDKGSSIKFLKKFVPNLCNHTRLSFSNNKEWCSFADNNFLDFDADAIIKDYFAGNEDVIDLLRQPENSVKFYSFVNDSDVDLENIDWNFPYITESGVSTTDYDSYLFFYSQDALQISKEVWLGGNTIQVLSQIYFEGIDINLKHLFEELGFRLFTKEFFINKIVADTNDSLFKNNVNETLDGDFDKSLAFVKYVYSCKDVIKDKKQILHNYLVSCLDLDDEEVYLCNDDLRYFNQKPSGDNSTYEDNKSHQWLSYNMMFCLNPRYFKEFDSKEEKDLESFFRQCFGIKTFTDKSFFNDVVLQHKKEIYPSLLDKDKMLAFISYLKRDANHIFDGSLSYNSIKDMPLLCADGSIISERIAGAKLISFSEDAVALHNKAWCPDVFCVLSDKYSSLPIDGLQLLKIQKFNINEVLEDIIIKRSFTNALKDFDMNIDFWRWIRANCKVISIYDSLKKLSLLDEDNFCCNGQSLYISDSYQIDEIEGLVKKYDPKAKFVSHSYIKDISDKNEKNEWFKLFKRIGLKFDNKDILFKSILPNLSSLEDDSVVAMMTKHLKDLKEVWDSRKQEIIHLKVRTKSGEFKNIKDALIIKLPADTISEPFNYIELSNEIAPDILKANTAIINLISNEFKENIPLTNEKEWAEAKIKEYITRIQKDEQLRSSIHVKFVCDLAALYSKNVFRKELLDKILYLIKGKDEDYKQVEEITLGSAYNPICDFESHGIIGFNYLSEVYLANNNSEIVKSFFYSIGVHNSILKEDLKYLSIRSFSEYFWTNCFSNQIEEFEKWIESGLFDNLVCIPTETDVKKAEDLYHPTIAYYVSHTPFYKEKIPRKSVVDKIGSKRARTLFETLPFNTSLSFEDCFYYLLNAQEKTKDERDHRETVISWILKAERIDSSVVEKYRESPKALWRNGKGNKKHIKELYVIHPEAKQQKAFFNGDEFVLKTDIFPKDINEFERLCDILQIKCLKAEDFITKPINEVDETEYIRQNLKPRLFVLSAIDDANYYKEKYELYLKKLARYRFVLCDKIELTYDTIHNDVERLYSDSSSIYYVNSWRHPRTFTKFCSKIRELLEIKVDVNVCEDVFDEDYTVERNIDKYCSATKYDEDFIKCLVNLDGSISLRDAINEVVPSVKDGYYTEVFQSALGNELAENDKQETNDNNLPDNSDVNSTTSISIHQSEDLSKTISRPGLQEPDDSVTFSNNKGSRRNLYDSYHSSMRPPKPFTKEEIERLRSHGVSVELESLSPTEKELDLLGKCGIKPEQIADTNYLAQLRLYSYIKDNDEEPEEALEDFVRNAENIATHRMKNGKYIHACSAASGVMYISPSVWNKILDDKWSIVVYRDGMGKNFLPINTKEEFLKLVEKDDIVLKITGEEKVEVVNSLYSTILKDVKGTAYTLIRVAARTNMDAVFAHYVGAMAESDDNDTNEYGY